MNTTVTERTERTGRKILVIDPPETEIRTQNPWIALTVIEHGGAWIERTKRPLDGWSRICRDAQVGHAPARRGARAPTRDAVRVAIRSSQPLDELDEIAQALADPVEGMAVAWETGWQTRIHDARKGLARATERTLRTRSDEHPLETVLRCAAEDNGHGNHGRSSGNAGNAGNAADAADEADEASHVAGHDGETDRPARPELKPRHVIVMVVVALTLVMGIQRGHDAINGIVRTGEWSAQATGQQTQDCRKRVAAALKTLRKHHAKTLRNATREATPRMGWTRDRTPVTWERLAHESIRHGYYAVNAGRSRWAQGWLDPTTGALRLVLNRNPDAGSLTRRLSTEGWPECRPTPPHPP